MNASYRFEVAANWTGGRNGVVTAEADVPKLAFSAPPEFQGQPGLWTPEHFLLGAVASCFVAAFGAVAAYSKFEAAALEITVEGTVEKLQDGYRFTRMLILPVLTVNQEADRERGIRLLEKAERACLVTRSLQCAVILESRVEVLEEVAAV